MGRASSRASRDRGVGYYTVREAARRLRVSPSTVWRWIESGRLIAYRVGPRGIRIKPRDLEALIGPIHGKGAPVNKVRVIGRTPTAAELARRQAVIGRLLALRQQAVITPMTTAELVRRTRREEMGVGEEDDS